MTMARTFRLSLLAALSVAASTVPVLSSSDYVYRYRSTFVDGAGPGAGAPSPEEPGTGNPAAGDGDAGQPGTPAVPGGGNQGPQFVPNPGDTTISVVEGETVDRDIGSYGGDASLWSCEAIPGKLWLNCVFENGRVRLVGRSYEASDGPLAVVVRRGPSYAVTTSPRLTVTRGAPTYRGYPIGDLYARSGSTERLLIGTYTGASEEWSCASPSNPVLPSWQTCAFEEGNVYLVATPPAGTGSGYQTVNILNERIGAGASARYTLYRDDRGYATSHTAEAPREGVASMSIEGDLYAPVGSPYRIRIGSYSGGEGWACFGLQRAMPASQDCEFVDGGIFLTGTPPAKAGDQYGVGVARDGRVLARSSLFQFFTDDRPYEHGAPSANPRGGTSNVDTTTDFYVVAGEDYRVRVGGYTGGEGGWTCFASQLSIPSTQRCEFSNGDIHLVGTAPAKSSPQYRISVARDGVVIQRAALYQFRSDKDPYLNGAPLFDAPRAGTVSMSITTDLYAVAGDSYRFKIGTYAGGDDGWACFGYQLSIPAGQRCEFVGGEIFLVGTAPSRFNSQYRIGVARDGRLRGTASLFQFRTDAPPYAHGAPSLDDPRAGTATLSVAGDITMAAGQPYRILVGSYSGGDGGWTCYGNQSSMPTGQTCDFVSGEIYLVGVAPPTAGSRHQYSFGVVRDGRVLRTSSVFAFRT